MKPVAAVVATPSLVLIALALAGLVFTGPLAAPALAAPPQPAPAQPVGAQEPVPGAGGPLRLDVTQVGPRVVTADGPGTLTVTGILTNTGDEPVADLVIRLQRGDPLRTEGEVRDALDGGAKTDAVTPQFTELPGELAPGGQLPVRMSVPLRGAPETGLALGATGVHEVLVNVNGVPRDGSRARLAAVRLLLPVLSLPPDPAAPADVPDASPTGSATPFSLLYPITEAPRRVATVPGEATLLTDDDLAASMAPGGRLGGLVAALAEGAPVGSGARAATCLAIDPDLVETASLMRQGYQVLVPGGPPVPGAGAEVAGRWLDSLSTVARGGCVLALPYADADLVALTRGGLGDLATTAISDGRQVLAATLATPVLPDTTWPVDGVADEPTLERTAAAGGRSVLLAADGVEQGSTPRSTGVLPIEGEPAGDGQAGQFAVLTDPLLTRAATGPDPGTATDGRGGAVPSSTPAGTVGPVSTQDTIGALAFRAQAPADGGAGEDTSPLVLAPPHRWAADGSGARALLDAVDQLLAAGEIVPRTLSATLTAGPPADADALPVAYPLQAGGREISGGVVGTVSGAAQDIDDLSSAAVPDSGVGVTPDQAFTPLRHGLFRSLSAAWRGRPGPATAAGDAIAARVAELRASVRVLEPPSPYSLGTSDAPILLTLANGLPVTVEVRVEIFPSSGLRVAPIETQLIPPLGRRQVRVSAEVTRSGQFTVQAALRTPDGELLGPPSRLRVRSTAYGTITVWLTASAGVLLVVLAVRRVIRRVRGDPGRHAGRAHPGQGPDPSHGPQVPPGPPHPSPQPAGPRTGSPRTAGPRTPGSPGPPDRRPRPPSHGQQPDPKTGDPFPDPDGATERLPAVRPRPHPDGPPGRGPQPPRVPST